MGNLVSEFVSEFRSMSQIVHKCAVDHGFWEGEYNNGEKIALMHSELSEALESMRKDNPPDDKIPAFSGVEAELADCVIRIMDFAHHNNLRLAEAIVAKHNYNVKRPYKHGKKF
jgi:NTP pyrophosphatase (non-canonical NTP hydrolase)